MSSSVSVSGPPQTGRERVQLGDIRPRREERVAAAGDDRGAHRQVARWIAGDVIGAPLDEVLRVIDEPRVIGSHVVRHEVDQESNPALGERRPGDGETATAAETGVDVVSANAVGRTDHVGVVEIREGGVERRHLVGGFERQLHASRAAFPHAHQPHRVDTRWRDLVPLGRGDVGERRTDPGAAADVVEPGRGVQFVDDRVGTQRIHRSGTR